MVTDKTTKLDKEIQEGLYDPKQFMVVKDPYSNPNVKHAWNKNSLYFRLQYLPHLREWYLRLDEIIKGKDTVLKEWVVGKGLKSEKRAIRKVEEIMKTYDPKAATRQITAKEWSAKKKHGYTLIKNGQKYILRLDKGKTVLEPVKVYDPKNRRKSIWMRFVNAHKHIRTAKGSLDLKAIGKLWRKEKRDRQEKYRPHIIQYGVKKAYDPKPSVPPQRWYEAMVKGIKKSLDVGNPYVTVKSIWAKLSPSKRAEFRAREKKGERFKYDLPLPVDKPTRGTGTVRMVKPFKLAEVQVNLSIKDYLAARASGLFSRMKRHDGTIALVSRCKSPKSNTNIFIDKMK